MFYMEIKPYSKNAKKHPQKQIEQVAASIEKFGMNQPIVVDKDGVIIVGHGRYEALKHLGREITDDMIKVVDLPKKEAAAYRLADNKLNESDWDMELVIEELKELDELVPLTGFDTDLLIEPEERDDEVPEAPEEPQSKLGDLYELGEHRVLCGDSTKLEDVEMLMDGKKADISFTSPPYNAGDNIRGHFYDSDNDDKTNDEYVSFLVNTTMNTLEVADYSFVNLGLLESNKHALIDYQTLMCGLIKDILVWNKKTAPPHINKGTFATKWEYVFVFSKDSKSRSFPCSWQGKYTNVIDTENNSGNEFAKVHRAGFPVTFPMWILQTMDFSKSVLDIFLGTGSTLIAAEKTGRICYGMELDPKYVDVIVQRYVDYTGNATIKKNGQEITWEKTTEKTPTT